MKLIPAQASALTRHGATVLMGFLIALSYSVLNNIDLFFNFTAVFIIIAFITAFITLFTVRQTQWQFLQTIAGLLTAGIILFFALEGIVAHFFAGH